MIRSRLQSNKGRNGTEIGRRRLRKPAFTLIELLVVIAVIGILATLVLSVTGHASRTAKKKAVQAELAKLETAIEDYKASLGHYPPDNVVANTNPEQVNPIINPLYYELTGTLLDPDSQTFSTVGGNERLSSSTIRAAFNQGGFANAARKARNVHNFVPWLEPSQHQPIAPNTQVEVLVAPVPGPRNPGGTGNSDPNFNPWRYVSSNPTNNPSSFDLWAEVNLGDKTQIIGNWEQ